MAMPSRLGRYAVRRRIGAGGFATVWLAYDEQLDSPVAIKVLADNWTEDQHVRQRFVEEGRYLRRVESPYVVSVYDAGELESGQPYLVMSYADQGTLATRLDAGGLSTAQALTVVSQTAAGLQALHDRGIVHRDVKPANVLFRSERESDEVRAMLGDLGLGKALDGSSRLTMIGGTPAFIAPEQANGESPGPAADQYSLGALTYLMLTGRRPFRRISIADAVMPEARQPVSTPERPFPTAVEVVLERAMAFAPTDRYRRVADFAAALQAAIEPVLGTALGTGLDAAAPATLLALDPDLTRPGPRPSSVTERAPLPLSPSLSPTLSPTPGWAPSSSDTSYAAHTSRRRRGLLVGAPLGLVALAAGGGVGYAAAAQARPDEVTVSSAHGSVSVTVPRSWASARSDGSWRPPGASQDYDAISVGTVAGWTRVDSRQQGVFVGLLGGDRVPSQLPQHPECGSAGTASTTTGSHPSVTVVYSGCPGGVTLERVILLAKGELLWVQVRSETQSLANDVVDSVEITGLA